MIKLTCACGKSLKAPYHLMGKVVLCSRCKSQLVVPFVDVRPIENPPAPIPGTPLPESVSAAPTPAVDHLAIQVQCQCGQHFMAAGYLRGQNLACPVCSRMIAVPPVDGMAPAAFAPLVPAPPFPSAESPGFEYQLAETPEPLKSTVDTLLDNHSPSFDGGKQLSAAPAPASTTPSSSSPTPKPRRPESEEDDPYSGSNLMIRGFGSIAGGAIFYFLLMYLENQPDGSFRAPAIVIVVYMFLGKEGVLGFFVLLGLVMIGFGFLNRR